MRMLVFVLIRTATVSVWVASSTTEVSRQRRLQSGSQVCCEMSHVSSLYNVFTHSICTEFLSADYRIASFSSFLCRLYVTLHLCTVTKQVKQRWFLVRCYSMTCKLGGKFDDQSQIIPLIRSVEMGTVVMSYRFLQRDTEILARYWELQFCPSHPCFVTKQKNILLTCWYHVKGQSLYSCISSPVDVNTEIKH